MPVDPELLDILALPEVQNAGDARERRPALKCAHVQARLSDQGRHPGDADRRSHHRTVKHCRCSILLVRLRQIGDVVFTTPAVRALRRPFPDAHLTYVVEPAAAPVVAGNPHLDEVIVAPRAPGMRG